MAIALSVNQKLKLKIERFAENGEGVGFFSEKPVYVPFAIPGEEVMVKVIQDRKNFARGRICEVVLSSPRRVEAPCRYYNFCGSCQWQHIHYESQLEFKRQSVQNELKKVQAFWDVCVGETKASSVIYGYRNKIQQPVCSKYGKMVTGFYYPGTHRLVPIQECLVQSPVANEIIKKLLELLHRFKIEPYNEISHRGILRHIFIRVGQNTQEVLLMLVVNAEDFPQGKSLADELMSLFPQIVSVIENVNIQKTNIILGKESRLLRGRPFIYERVHGIKFRISANSFFQVNTLQAEQIVEQVKMYANLIGDEEVVDVFSGVGLIGLSLASKAKKIYAIEENLEAVEDGWASAEANHIQNADLICSVAVTGLRELSEKNIHPKVIVLDPPRQGCGSEVLKEVVRLNPEKVIYVSCEPRTLIQDLNFLSSLGYQTLEIQPIDLFPHTFHVECVAKIQKFS